MRTESSASSLSSLAFALVLARKPGRTLHVSDDRMERAVGMLRRAEIAHSHMRLARQPLQQRRGQARLADTGLAGEQNDVALARLRLGPATKQEFAFFFSPDHGGQPARVQRLETTFLRTVPHRRPGARQGGDALEVLRAKIDQLEQIAQELARALRDHDAVGLSDPLQPRGEIRRVADDAPFLRLPRTHKIADNHDPGPNSDPHMQGRAAAVTSFGAASTIASPRPDRALGVVLMRQRIAEISEHAVAHVFGDEAAAALIKLAQHL